MPPWLMNFTHLLELHVTAYLLSLNSNQDWSQRTDQLLVRHSANVP